MSVQSNQHTTSSTQHQIHKPNMWDILVSSDLLNVIILAIAFVYLGNKYLPKIINERKNQISKELEDAKQARTKAEEELQIVKDKTEKTILEIKGMKEEAKKTAETIKKQIEEETEKELEQLRIKIKREINTTQEEAIEEIKKSASKAAFKLAEETLSQMSNNTEIQEKLFKDFLVELDKPSKN